MSNEDLYTKCPLCEGKPLPFPCLACEGVGFLKAGVSTGQLAYLVDDSLRVKHIDKYFDSHKVEMNTFIDWLRENPYPETP